YTDYAFSYAGMTKNVSDASHRLVSGVQVRFGIHGEVIRETQLVTATNTWYWTKTSPGSGWNSQSNFPVAGWNLAASVRSYTDPYPPWLPLSGWQDSSAKWVWWNPDAATISTTETVWFRNAFTLPTSKTIYIE